MAHSNIKSAFEGGDLVFRSKADGTELLRISPSGVSISGLLYPTADGSSTDQITTDGSGTLTFGAAADGS